MIVKGLKTLERLASYHINKPLALVHLCFYIFKSQKERTFKLLKWWKSTCKWLVWSAMENFLCFLNERNYGWWVWVLAAYRMWETHLFHPCWPESLQQILESNHFSPQKRKLFGFAIRNIGQWWCHPQSNPHCMVNKFLC